MASLSVGHGKKKNSSSALTTAKQSTTTKQASSTISQSNIESPTTAIQSNTNNNDWICTHCQTVVLSTKKRCGNCQSWKGGVRLNIQKRKQTLKSSESQSRSSLKLLKSPEDKSNDKLKPPSSKLNNTDDNNDWTCPNCQTAVQSIKKRCGNCQSWRGGERTNIQKRKVLQVRSVAKQGVVDPEEKAGSITTEKNRSIPIHVRSNGVAIDTVETSVAATASAAPFTILTKESEEECNLDDVACCLCKCAVDFGDDFFFLPEETITLGDGAKEDMETEADREQSTAASLSVNEELANSKEKAKEECKPSAIVSSDVSVVEVADNESSSSPKTVIHPKDEADALLVHSSRVNGVESVENDASRDITNVDMDERKPSPIPIKTTVDEESEDGSEAKPPFQLPRRFYNPGNSLILCDGPEYAPRKKNGSGPTYRCERAYHQLCHFIPGKEDCCDIVLLLHLSHASR